MPQLHLVLTLLAVVAALAALGRRVGLPGPIVFALGGLALALVPGLPRVALPPDLVLLVFLPPLIFAAAQGTTWAEVRGNARPILLLAVGLVLATMAAVAAVAHAVIPEFSWAAAFTLGAVVAPPDAVAAKAIADTLRLPRCLVAVLEGEGLFSDATALVAFQLASAAAVSGVPFAPGQAVLQLLVAAGVAAAASRDWGHTQALWGTLDFLLTGLSFVLVGLQLRSAVLGAANQPPPLGLVVAAALVSVTVIVVRLAWVFAAAWAGPDPVAPRRRGLTVAGWAGMRGVVSLAVALSLPATTAGGGSFRARDAIVFITFVVIFVTLVGQGLTLPVLIRRLGLGGAEAGTGRPDGGVIPAVGAS